MKKENREKVKERGKEEGFGGDKKSRETEGEKKKNFKQSVGSD